MSYDDSMAQIDGPEYLVLEMYHELNSLYGALSNLIAYSCDINAVMDGLMLCVSDNFEAQCAVEKYCEEVQEAYEEIGVDEAGQTVATAIRTLGLQMHVEFTRLGLYGQGGLFYRFHSWIDPHTVVFEKYMETDAFPDVGAGRSFHLRHGSSSGRATHVRFPIRDHRYHLHGFFNNFRTTGVWRF